MKLIISVLCHACGREAEIGEVQRRWLTPYYVRRSDGFEQTQLCPRCARWHFRYWIKIVLRLRLGRLSWLLSPGYGWCLRCKTSWKFCEGHSTQYTEGSGCFPLCEQCWSDLTPTQRLRYYRQLYDQWIQTGSAPEIGWPEIERAVLSE